MDDDTYDPTDPTEIAKVINSMSYIADTDKQMHRLLKKLIRVTTE